ncbi:MAG: hypothetical protein IJN63_04075 [Clostridia bacterium]|nr:hypothetical protein [Clostridia bacterium]
MKKSIKRLSAILAILVLSMTIAVPVTAVEYSDLIYDEASLYAAQRIANVSLSYSVDEEIVLEGGVTVLYLDGNNTFYITTTAYATEDATEFVGFSCGSIGLAYYIFEVYNSDYFDAYDEATSLYDSLGATASTTLTSSNVRWVDTVGEMRWGDVFADGLSERFHNGSDFYY